METAASLLGLDELEYSKFIEETGSRAGNDDNNSNNSNNSAGILPRVPLNRMSTSSSSSSNDDAQLKSFSKSESLVKVYKGGHVHTIKNASAFKLGFAHSIYSNEFTINGHNWQIISYLGGETEDVADYISLFLGYVGPYQQCRANWTLRIVNQQDSTKSRTREWKRGDKYNTFQKGRRWGWQKFILQKQAFQQENGFLGKDLSITFEADVEVYGFTATAAQIPPSMKSKPIAKLDGLLSKSYVSLSSDFENALYRGDAFSDCEIECDGETFHLHSQILATRSPVFARMLTGPFRERIVNESLDDGSNTKMASFKSQTKFKISITDIEPYVVKEMIRFIYTGRVDFNGSRQNSLVQSFQLQQQHFNNGNNSNSSSNSMAGTPKDMERMGGENSPLPVEQSASASLKRRRIDSSDNSFANDEEFEEAIQDDKRIYSPLLTSPNPDELLSPSPRPVLSTSSSASSATSNKNSKEDCDDVSTNNNKRKREHATSLGSSRSSMDESEESGDTFDLVAALMEAADKYEIEHLRKLCEAYLAQTISPQTALNTLLLADRHNSKDLKHHALRYLGNVTNLTSVRKHSPESWNSLDKALANEILNYVITESAKATDIISGGIDHNDLGFNRSAVLSSPPIPSLPQTNPFSFMGSSILNNATAASVQSASNSAQNGNSAYVQPLVQFPQMFQQFSASSPAGFFF